MDAVRWRQIDQLFDAALDLPADTRAVFVTENSGKDEDLRNAVLELLKARERSDDFLQSPAMRIAAKDLVIRGTSFQDAGFVNKKIAAYRVERLLGAGGMGEVYLATDEKLKRSVALKILPSEFLTNDEHVKRFAVEARAVSSLNHPNIVTIYDVGEFEGVNYIATEFVEGKTLRELMNGRFILRNILSNSIQICDALAAAHSSGIIHRDIKPENIMVRKDGYTKILDFGLAKLTDPGRQTSRDLAATTKGVIIGTPAYMSPSQIGDENIDHRTDLWSCGVVLYEFLTGSNPFKKANRTSTFKAIMSEMPPPPSSLNPEIPPDLDRILLKLLEKDPGMGYQTAADLCTDLKRIKREIDSAPSWSGDSHRSVGPASLSGFRPLSYASLFIIVTLLAGVLTGIYFYTSYGNRPDATDWTSAQNVQLTDQPGTEFFPSISPDGKSFVYAAGSEGNFSIYLQRVGGRNAINLTPDIDGSNTQPAFSPDGETIAFRSEADGGGIYLMGISMENLRRVSDFGYHPSWSPDGRNLVVSTFSRDRPTVSLPGVQGLWIIDVKTGEKRELYRGIASLPAWSPGGERIAFWHYGNKSGRSDIATIPAGGGQPLTISEGFGSLNWNPVWSPDGNFLYFVSNRGGNQGFWRVSIDKQTGESLSEPEPIVTPSKFSRHPTFSRDGKRLIYVQTDNQSNIQGIEFDPKRLLVIGETFWITEGDREVSRAELSSDGTKFLMRLIRRTQDDIVTVNRNGTDWLDVTNDEPFDRYSRWSPDGRQIAFASDRSGDGEIWICNSDGTNLRQLTFKQESGHVSGFPVWSPDGRQIVYASSQDTYILDPTLPEAGKSAKKMPRPENGESFVPWDWSPDGKKLAGNFRAPNRGGVIYSFETGKFTRYANRTNSVPSWLPDSRHLVYSEGNRIILLDTVTLRTRELLTTTTGEPRSTFVSRDGKLLYYVLHQSESDIWLLDLEEKPALTLE